MSIEDAMERKPLKKIVKTDFKPTITITRKLLEDLKQGNTTLIPGQWCWSVRDKKKVKYVGTFYKSVNGVIKPVVKFSERKPGQTIQQWNRSFKWAKEKSKVEEIRARRIASRMGALNQRQEFTKADAQQQQPPTPAQQQPTTNEPRERSTGTNGRFYVLLHKVRDYTIKLFIG